MLFFIVAFFISSAAFASGDSSVVIIKTLDEIEGSYFYNSKTYLLGSVSPLPDSILFNGEKALLSSEGTFLVYINLLPTEKPRINSPVKCGISIQIFNEGNIEEQEKFVDVFLPTNNFPEDSIIIDYRTGVYPNRNSELRAGDKIEIDFRATPGCRAFFTVNNDSNKYPLYERIEKLNYDWGEGVFGGGFFTRNLTELSGYYHADFIIPDQKDSITLKVNLSNNYDTLNFTLPTVISIIPANENVIAVTKFDPNLITARYGPRLGYKLFLQENIPLNVESISNGWVKAEIGGNNTIFVPQESVKLIYDTLCVNNSSITTIIAKNNKNVDIQFGFTHRVPVEVKQLFNPARYELYFYGVTSNIDWVKYNDVNEFVSHIEHYQISDDVLKVIITLKSKTFWGYKSHYTDNTYVLSIKKPLQKNRSFFFGANQLKGRRIAIDPGHGADTGAAGPGGLTEREINFVIGTELKEELENNGAIVFLTRNENENLPLRKRRERVNSFEPDISISMHNNAVPLTVDPLKHNGYSAYYYYPQAYNLTKKIYDKFGDKLGLPDFGFYWDNLYMSRNTEAISLLVEPTFIIHPNQEILLKKKEFRSKIIESVVEALEEFFEEYAE